jgi:hypothetical protein
MRVYISLRGVPYPHPPSQACECHPKPSSHPPSLPPPPRVCAYRRGQGIPRCYPAGRWPSSTPPAHLPPPPRQICQVKRRIAFKRRGARTIGDHFAESIRSLGRQAPLALSCSSPCCSCSAPIGMGVIFVQAIDEFLQHLPLPRRWNHRCVWYMAIPNPYTPTM